MLLRFASNRSTRFLFPSPARLSAASAPLGNSCLVVTGTSVAMTDLYIADLRARLLEELKNSLKVRSFFFQCLPRRSGLKAAHCQARDSLASTTIRVCICWLGSNS